MTEKDQETRPDDAPARKRDADLVVRLRQGDQRAFLRLFHDWHPTMVRLALNYVRSLAVAEEVAQEAWLHFMQQLTRFEGRSSLKTWTFRILVNRAISRGKREHRSSTLLRETMAAATSTGHPDTVSARGVRRLSESDWASGGKGRLTPEESLLNAETRLHLEDAIRDLPERQKLVLTLRDVQGWCSADVCELLEISPENQRVILHRARVQVRRALIDYLGLDQEDVDQPN